MKDPYDSTDNQNSPSMQNKTKVFAKDVQAVANLKFTITKTPLIQVEHNKKYPFLMFVYNVGFPQQQRNGWHKANSDTTSWPSSADCTSEQSFMWGSEIIHNSATATGTSPLTSSFSPPRHLRSQPPWSPSWASSSAPSSFPSLPSPSPTTPPPFPAAPTGWRPPWQTWTGVQRWPEARSCWPTGRGGRRRRCRSLRSPPSPSWSAWWWSPDGPGSPAHRWWGSENKWVQVKFFILLTENPCSIKNVKTKIKNWEVFNRQLIWQDLCLNFLEPNFQRNLTSAIPHRGKELCWVTHCCFALLLSLELVMQCLFCCWNYTNIFQGHLGWNAIDFLCQIFGLLVFPQEPLFLAHCNHETSC